MPAPSLELGEPSEAMVYIRQGLAAWINTEGAIDWLKQQAKKPTHTGTKQPPKRWKQRRGKKRR